MGLIIKKLSISIGKKDIFHDESVGIGDNSKVGLIGRNGVGKTTLIKAILGQVDYTGDIEYTGKAAHFSQDVSLDQNKLVKEVLLESTQIYHQKTYGQELKEIEEKLMSSEQKTNEEISRLTERYVELQTKAAEHQTPRPSNKLKNALRTLEVQDSWLEHTVKSLSTGQRAIIALAQIISSDADFLILDEPTNHLDFKRLDILENYLKNFKGMVLMVTHDRYFLDRVCDTILKIENGKWIKYNTNYSGYIRARLANFEAQQKAYAQEKKYIFDQKDKISRLGTSPSKVRQAKYRVRLLEKREVLEKPDLDKSDFETHFEASPIHSPVVVELKDLTVGYDKPLISDINLNIAAGQRVILIGENGMGKSTLFKTIEGRVEPLSGEVIVHPQAKIGYADQELKDLTSDATLYDEIFALLKNLAETRRHLSMVGFIENHEVYKPISKLSMGEKSRLNLLKILIDKPNLLLLDEPTNHLDIDAREIIETAFLNYDGAIFAVSHDRYFIQKIAQRILKVSDKTIKEVPIKK